MNFITANKLVILLLVLMPVWLWSLMFDKMTPFIILSFVIAIGISMFLSIKERKAKEIKTESEEETEESTEETFDDISKPIKEKFPYNEVLYGNFHNYWVKHLQNPHIAFQIKSLSKNPDLLVAFLQAYKNFDFEKVQNYMQEVNWKYAHGIPTVDDLKYTVISLAIVDSKIESGGFTVNCENNQCSIKFSYSY